MGKQQKYNIFDGYGAFLQPTSCRITSVPYLEKLNQKFAKKDSIFVSMYSKKDKVGLLKAATKSAINYDILLTCKKHQIHIRKVLFQLF